MEGSGAEENQTGQRGEGEVSVGDVCGCVVCMSCQFYIHVCNIYTVAVRVN